MEARWFHGLADRTVHLPRSAPEWRRRFWISKQMVLRDSAKLFTLARSGRLCSFFSPRDPYIAVAVWVEVDHSVLPPRRYTLGKAFENVGEVFQFSLGVYLPVFSLPSWFSETSCWQVNALKILAPIRCKVESTHLGSLCNLNDVRIT